MLRGASLVTFSVRALVLLVLVPLLRLTVAERYNEALVAAAGGLLPDGVSLSVLRTHILIGYGGAGRLFSVDGLTLHSGLVLLTVLVLAAVGIGPLSRVGWLAGLALAGFLLQVAGVALLARGVLWAASGGSPEASAELVLRLFAIFWGLLPALAGGAWAYLYWLPRVAVRPPSRGRSASSTSAV